MEPSNGTPLMFTVAASLVAVPALPPMESVEVDTLYKVPALAPITPLSAPSFGALVNVFVPEKVLLSPRSVDDAAVIVLLSPKLKLVPLIVREEFCNAEFGKLREDDAMPYNVPLLPPINPASVPT